MDYDNVTRRSTQIACLESFNAYFFSPHGGLRLQIIQILRSRIRDICDFVYKNFLNYSREDENNSSIITHKDIFVFSKYIKCEKILATDKNALKL